MGDWNPCARQGRVDKPLGPELAKGEGRKGLPTGGVAVRLEVVGAVRGLACVRASTNSQRCVWVR